MENNKTTVEYGKISAEALEDLLYAQKWKDLEIVSIDVEEDMNIDISWRDLTDIDDKVRYDAYNRLQIFIDDAGLHVNCLWEFVVWNVYTCYTFTVDNWAPFINYILENGPQLIRDFAESIPYIDKKESRF